jgi:hypothetical protein
MLITSLHLTTLKFVASSWFSTQVSEQIGIFSTKI